MSTLSFSKHTLKLSFFRMNSFQCLCDGLDMPVFFVVRYVYSVKILPRLAPKNTISHVALLVEMENFG